MAESSMEPKLSLRLVVDEEKNKVVLAEACRDFVDVLFSLLTLPMGSIVRLLEKHRKSEIGCFSNLYKSVVDMGVDDFETEACKEMLMYPRSLRDVQCKRLKLNINPNDDLKYFACESNLKCKLCSNFNTSQCKCGELMNHEVELNVTDNLLNDANGNGVFVSGRCSFIITDDLKVAVRSTDFILEKLDYLGCGDVSKLREKLLDVAFEEVMNLLQCLFTSKAPLTDAFLKKQTQQGVSKMCETLSPLMRIKRDGGEPEEILTLSAIVRKHDNKILYVECGEDFVDLLFTFLAIPLESVLEISGNSFTFGCIGNLFKSFKDLSAATEVSTTKSMPPHYYKCQKQLLDIIIDESQVYYRYMGYRNYTNAVYRLTTNCNHTPYYSGDNLVHVVLMDPKGGSGFMKRDTKFNVSDDLIVTPMTSSSAFCLLKKFQIHAKDLVVQEISINKTEATNLLRASLATSSALNTALRNLIVKKKPKQEC